MSFYLSEMSSLFFGSIIWLNRFAFLSVVSFTICQSGPATNVLNNCILYFRNPQLVVPDVMGLVHFAE